MSFLFTQPQLLADAATDMAGIGSTLQAANTAASLPTTSVLAAGADEVSAATASVFGAHAQQYQAMGAQAARLHEQLVQTMNAASGAYAGAEADNAKPMQSAGRVAQGAGARSLLAPPGSASGFAGAATAPAGRPVGLLPANRGSVATAAAPARGATANGTGFGSTGAGAGSVRAAPVVGRRSGSAGASGLITAGHKRTGRSFGPGGPGARGDEATLRAC